MNIMICLARRCKVCKRWALSNYQHNYEIENIDEIDDFPIEKLAMSEITHCGHKAMGSHVAIKIGNTEIQYQTLNTADMPIGGMTYSADNVALMDEGARKQLAQWKANKESLLEKYWLWLINNSYLNKAIYEISQSEFERAFRSAGIPLKGSYNKHLIRKVYLRCSDIDQKRVFLMIAEEMITDIIWSMSAMEWPVEEWKKYGRTRILWPALYMPLSDELMGMRISAAARLGVQLDETGQLNKRIISLENTITRCNEQISKLTDMLSQRQVEVTQLETKLAEAYTVNRQLTDALDRTKSELMTVKSAPSQKSESMKSLISEMRDQLKQYEKEEESEGPAFLEDNASDINQVITTSLSNDLKVGIIGGWRKEHTDKYYPNIMTTPGVEEQVGFERVLRSCDILVVLTKHVSHRSMWAVKSYIAIEQEKPILYTTHLSIPIILKEVAELAGKS